MNAVIYARYSSHQQRDVSIEQQVKACMDYATAQDMTVLKVYDDHAMTGTNDQRPQFRQMIHDSAAGQWQYVIVYSLDRFSRDKYDSVVHKKTLKDNGVRVLSATENITDNPAGALMETILEGFADYYSKELRQKILRGMRSNAEKGLVNGPLCYGYRRGKDDHYEIVPAEAEVIIEIFTRVSNGEPIADIVRSLNERGLKTRRGNAWNKGSFSKLLHNEEYIGVYNRCGVRIEGGVPAIVDQDLFDQVQEKCRTKKNPRDNPQRRRQTAGTYLLTGKLYCGLCKSPMIGISGTSKTGSMHYYYICKKHRVHACPKKQVTRNFAERCIASLIRDMISRPDVIAWIADAAMDYLAEENAAGDLPLLRDRLEAVRKEKANIYTAIKRGMIDDEIQAMFDNVKAEESSLNAQIAFAESSRQPVTREHIIAYLESFAQGDIEDKRYQEDLFDAFLVRAYLYDDHIKLILNYCDRQEIDITFDDETINDIIDEDMLSESSYNGIVSPPECSYTNTHLYFSAGMIVLVAAISAKEKRLR